MVCFLDVTMIFFEKNIVRVMLVLCQLYITHKQNFSLFVAISFLKYHAVSLFGDLRVSNFFAISNCLVEAADVCDWVERKSEKY